MTLPFLNILMKIKSDRRGFWSAMMVIFIVTLGLMGLGSFVLMRSEGHSSATSIQAVQAEYAANGGAYYGLMSMANDTLDESSTLSIGHADVTLDTTSVVGSAEVLLYVTATVGDIQSRLRLRVSPGTGLVDKAIYTTGHVFNVTGKDSTGTNDPSRVVTQAPSVPAIDEAALAAMSTPQGHDQFDALFTPSNGYPDGSFYRPDGVTPNVTHVMNDFKVKGGRTIYGIFVVEGDVVLNGSARIEGVVYLPNPTSTIITGGGDPGESSITGGLISHGNIQGFGNHISVKHWPEFMGVFCQYQIGPDSPGQVTGWEYL